MHTLCTQLHDHTFACCQVKILAEPQSNIGSINKFLRACFVTGLSVMQACKDEPGAVQAAYNALLDRPGGDQNNPDVRAPVLRMRVLKSLHCVLLAQQSKLDEQRSYGTYQTYKSTERRVVSLLLP